MSVLRRRRLAGLAALGIPITALVVAVLVVTWGHESSTEVAAAGATNPAPGLNFSIGIDEADGCDTLGGDTKCTLPEDAAFTVSVSLDSMPDKVTVYEGMDMVLHYSGVISHDDADIATYWPECTFEATHYEPGLAAFSCAAFNPPDSEYLGVLAKIHFDCSASGSITLVGAAEGDTGLASGGLTYREGHDETLTVNCGGEAPTNTPPGPTSTQGPPTNTPTPTNTPGPATPTPTRTNTPIPPTATNTPAFQSGDVNDDGKVNSMDALWVLWIVGDIVDDLPNPEAGDVNQDGLITAVDAALILQKDAGLIPSLPV
jgi:hypothetical protein